MNPDILDRWSYRDLITVGENGVMDGDASINDLRSYTERLKRDRRTQNMLIPKIADQGFTLTWLKNYLLFERKVSSIRICCLLDKVLKYPSAEVWKMREQLLID